MAHRRRVGVGKKGPRYSKKAEEIKAVSTASAMETVKKLEIKLTEFAKKHRHEIRHDPAFRAKFLEMCAPLGVDPLSSEKTLWGSLLGIGSFYYELAVKVAEVCLATRSRNGGIISVTEAKQLLKKRGTKFQLTKTKASLSSSSSAHDYSENDIITSIKKLSVLGGGFRTVTVGKTVMIVSVPTELDNDHMEAMDVAQRVGGGRVTVKEVREATKWSEERAKRSLELLLSKGMAWIDSHEGVDHYWFPSVWKEGIEASNENED